MDYFLFSKYSVQAFTQLALSLLITGYLVTVQKKSKPTRLLVAFFIALSLALCNNLALLSLDAPWVMYIGVAQGAAMSVSMLLLMQFAYAFPENRHGREQRVALFVFLLIDIATLAHMLHATWNFPVASSAYALIGAVFVGHVVWIVSVFVRKMLLFSCDEEQQDMVRHCYSPCGRRARALRSFAGLTLVWLVLSGAVLLEGIGLLSVQILLQVVSASFIVFLFAFVLVYINNSPEPSSFGVKLVGLAVVAVMLAMGDLASFVLWKFEDEFDRERRKELALYRNVVAAGNFSALPRDILFVDVHYMRADQPQAQPVYTRAGAERNAFHREYVADLFTRRVIARLRTGEPDVNSIKMEEGQRVTRAQLVNAQHRYDIGGLLSQRLQFSLYYFVEGDFLYSVHYPHTIYTRYIHGFARSLLLFICGSLAAILLLFPLFFRSALLRPLRALLVGVEKVDRGDWDARVEVRGEDEIGFLARAFNRMVESVNAYALDLRVSNEKLAEVNRTLEQRVRERTRDLQAKNDELEQALHDLGQAQERLFLQEKMVSLGGLVAGVAHEINNPIGAISAANDVSRRCAERIEEQVSTERDIDALRASGRFVQALQLLRDNSGVVREASQRIARIVGSLKSFARLDESEFQFADIHDGLDSALMLLNAQIAANVEVEKAYGDFERLYCAPGQLNQVFLNVIKNALQAVELGGSVKIATGEAGDGVYVSVEDTGIGIARAELEHIFDFSFRKDSARVKLGAGLSSAYRIVQEHGGQIEIDSEVGRGTTVRILLPRRRNRPAAA